MVEEELLKIYNHCKRIISLINEVSFSKSFIFEPDDFKETDDYIYLNPIFKDKNDPFLSINFEAIGDYFEKKYGDLILISVDQQYEVINTYVEDNMEIKNFSDTIDLDDTSFELWFKLEYGG